jgi:glycosyltransferase involved in cell wall biosynthesis
MIAGRLRKRFMNGPVICTIIAKNYLAYARCLVDSFLKHHPDGHAFVLLIDDPDGYFDPDQERFTTVRVEDVGIPQFWVMAFRYTVLELSTAVKPFFLEYIFEHCGCDKVCYFDPDIFFYEPIDEIWDLLDSYGVVLIPHLTGFLDDDFTPNELDILRSGVYNLGFIGLSRHPELNSLLHWWQNKLSKHCVVALERGLFVDQRWMDLAPALFPSVYIHRDPGCNVAYWNLYHRAMAYNDGRYTVNSVPLKFFHFSGFSPDQTRRISKHQNRYTFRDLPHLKPLFDGYRECLLAHGYEITKGWPYTYNYQQDESGIRIPDAARSLWREWEAGDPSWNPFDASSGNHFVASLLAWLNEPVDGGSSSQPPVTRLALALYRQRSDLQRIFPDVLGRDRVEYARWFVNWGRDQFALDDFFVKPMEEQLARFLASRASIAQQGFGAWFYQRTANWLFRIGLGARIEQALGTGLVARVRGLFIRSDRNRLLAPKKLPPLGGFQREEADVGVNVFGYLCDETGVGESARATLRALHDQGFPVAWTMVRGHTARRKDRSVLHLPEGNPYDVNLLYVNADQMDTVYSELGPEIFAERYNIAYWAWELDQFPEQWFDRFRYLDEIWVGSRFVQNTLAQVAPIPVVIMGVGMEKSPDPNVTRSVLGLPEDKFLFLSMFDMLSVIERKNPFGAVAAYRRAFEHDFQDTALVIKVANLDRFPQYREPLEQAVTSVSGILVDGYLDRSELDGLFNVCDAYVSLHRSEGFGMTIAEAMVLGKPAIATDYSGNTDFMNVANSYPVEYRLVELEQDYGPYRRGNAWADPDLDHAATQMRRVFENRDEAIRKGARAAADMKRWYGSEAIARKIIERLHIVSPFVQAR